MKQGNIWALADLHLTHGVPEKDMAVFGKIWEGYMEKIALRWKQVVKQEDLVLIAGDISWATKLKDAEVDLRWIDALPGTKVLIKGNHDFWWSSLKQIETILPPSLHLIQNNAFHWHEVTIAGTRLWDTPELSFDTCIQMQPNPRENVLIQKEQSKDTEKIYQRELMRLEISLKQLDPNASLRIAMTHYPPVGPNLEPSAASNLLEKYRIDCCVFGHLHSLKKNIPLFGTRSGIRYLFSACDYLDFHPLLVAP